MREHIQEHIIKYFPEDEPVVLEEIVIPEDEDKAGEEEDGKFRISEFYLSSLCLYTFSWTANLSILYFDLFNL